MSLWDGLTKWQQLCAAILVTVALLGGSWKFMNSQFMPRAEAGEDKAAIIERWIENAEQTIEQKYDEIIKIKYDPSLSDRAKEELTGVKRREIARLEKQIDCWRTTQDLSC